MKRFNFLSMVIAGVLMVAAVGCTTLTETQDDYYSEQGTRATANRVYVDDPYRGTVVLERDPWTGRYYEVSPYGTYNNRYYTGNVYGNRNYGRVNRGYNRGGGYYRGTQPRQTQPTEEQKRQNEQNKSDARNKVLGRN